MSRFRPAIDALDAYVPGEQPAAGAKFVKLNTNENPYPPSPRALAALRTVDGETLRRYPQPFADAFRNSAAEVLGAEQVGSAPPIDAAALRPGRFADGDLMHLTYGPGARA